MYKYEFYVNIICNLKKEASNKIGFYHLKDSLYKKLLCACYDISISLYSIVKKIFF